MPQLHIFCVFLVISVFLNESLAIFEDQAGKFDWRQQYVGGIQHIGFDQCGQSVCKRVLVATDQHVVAALSMKSGEIVWRQLMETSEAGRIDDMLLVDGNLIVTLGGGTYIRCFSAAVGHLHWEVNKEIEVLNKPALLGVVDADDEKVVVILAGNSVYGVDVLGRQQWTRPLANSETTAYKFLSTEDGTATVVGVTAKSHIVVLKINSEGTILSQNTVSAAWISDDTQCKFTGSNFACIDPNGILHHLSLQSPDVLKSALLQDLGVTCIQPEFISTQSETSQGELAVLCKNSNALVLRVRAEGVKLIKDLPGAKAVHVLKYGDSKAFVAVGKTQPQVFDFRGYDLETGLELPELMQSIPIPDHHGRPAKLIGLIKRKEASPTIRMLLLCEDDSLMLYHHSPSHMSSGRLAWVREEALSKVVSVDMVDLPVSPILAKMEDEFGNDKGFSGSDILAMFSRRLKTQFSQLQTFISQLQTRLRIHKQPHHHEMDSNVYDKDDEDEDADQYLFRDDFNLKKIIILATDVGKIYGLYSTTGRILWRHLLPDVTPFSSANQKQFLIFMQRTTAHFPHDPECLLVGQDKLTGLGVLYQFHPVSGQPLEGAPYNGHRVSYNVAQAMMLPHMDKHFLHPVVVMDTQQNLHVYPSEATEMVRGLASSLFMYTSDSLRAQITGHTINKDLKAQTVWNVNLGGEGQTITNILSKRSNEHVHSQGIVLADRSVLYKYLNPNMVVVTTEALDNTQKGTLNVYLLDVVSGQLVFHCSHKKVKGPVQVVYSENWVVYFAWNQRHRRSEISVLELYEGKKQSNATAFSSLHPPPLPMVLRQSYIFSAHVNAMQATLTEKGIASKHVLFALSSGAILEMPKALLDPRRPEVPTQEHREEGIIPYIPELPRQNEAIINYNHSVYNARGVYTAPAGLESHSMVLVYGLDLFYTRVLPSKMFDVLKEDFDYFFIGSVTLGMIVISLITKKLAARKALTRAWK